MQAGGVACLALPLHARAAEPGVVPAELLSGQTIALQGGRSAHAAEAQAGIRTVFDEVNRGGGVAGRKPVLRALGRFEVDLGGVAVRCRSGEHTGSRFVDLAMVGGDGRLLR